MLLAIRGLSKGREGKNGLRHRALWSRPTLGRHTSGTGHGDGDNDAGIGISSSFEHYIRICDEQQRLKLDHAEVAFGSTNTSTSNTSGSAAMPAPTAGRDSRRGSRASGESGPHNLERKEKAKSTQVYGQSSPQRSQQGTRITSAPIVERRRGSGYAAGLQRLPPSQEYMAQAGTGAAEAGQDEDEATGVVGAMRQYEPFRSPQVRDMSYVR